MTQNFLDCLKTLFGCTWSLLTSFHLPGTNITPAAMLLFGAVAYLSLKFFTNVIGNGGVQDANAFRSYHIRESGSDQRAFNRNLNSSYYNRYTGL